MNTPSENKNYLPLEEETLDFKKILFQVIGNWYWFAISIFVGMFIAYLVNRYSEPVFSVKASILVEGADGRRIGAGVQMLMKEMNITSPSKRIENEIGILKSYSIANKTIKELPDFHTTYVSVGRREIKESKLYNRAPFVVTFDSTKEIPFGIPIFITYISKDKYLLEQEQEMFKKGEHSFGEMVTSNSFGFRIEQRSSKPFTKDLIGRKYYFVANSLNSLAKSYKGILNVELNNDRGSILTLTSTGFVAEQEADYLNKLMEIYIRQGLEEKNKTAENTIIFINKQLAEMADSLRKAEQKLENFRVNNKVFNLSAEGNLLFEKLKIIQDQKAASDLNYRYYNYLKNYIQSKSSLKDIVAPIALGIDDIQLTTLITQVNDSYIHREELLLSTKENSPSLTQVDNRIENLKKSILEKTNSLIEAHKLLIDDINNRLKSLEKEMLHLPLNERKLINIEREFNLMDKLYTYLLEKRSEAAIARASNIADSKVLDYALPDNFTIIKPKKQSNYLLGFVFGVAIPFAFILLYNFFNNKIIDIKEIVKFTNTPIIGSVGHNKFQTDLPVVEKPKSTLTESFRGIRTNLQYLLRDPKQKVITVTSTISGEGKTFIAANLGAIISLTGKKVLILGLDLRKPKLQNIFGPFPQKGLSTYLIGRDTAEEIVIKTEYDNLFYAPSGPIPPNPAELIESSKMDEFVRWAKEHYDFIILDTPPIAVVTDALLTQRFTDMVLFVVRFNYSNKDVLKLVEGLRKSNETKNIALIINDLQHRRGYGYGYSYSYGYSYGYGHTYGYGQEKSEGGYYTDDEPPLNFRDRIKRLF
ncbi:MAG: GumC family protein [Tenuifilaceae bacterium]